MDLKNKHNVDKVPQYYTNALEYLSKRVNFEGKQVLEVGGSGLPYSLTNHILKVKQWVCIDFLDWGGGYQQDFSKNNYNSKRHFYKASEFDSIDWEKDNIVIDGDANDILPNLPAAFDIIFSINCFEHVSELKDLINNIYISLKRGGVLYSNFGPIWSCSVGHHMSIGKKLHFNSNENILAKHEHLLFTPLEMKNYLIQNGIDLHDVKSALHKVYEKKDINRLMYSDYYDIFEEIPFRKKEILPSYKIKIEDSHLKKLNSIKIDDYETYSIKIYFIK